ncbi:hypothetical protein NM688_g281 [Phlebia brevispora]|uniref:Uncharacterized protein n=1 Tax=Phlebia brevispora TaxID=194682 RepID=A0ACC1TF36_9APHY|nr:hypothetical protein NM688_g281 [Phlebia brevispora]
MTTSGRSRHAAAILGPELSARLPEVKVLLVGAGGIGCELLKDIVLTGIGHITLLDLDTIDLSNLNRQFLFRKKDIKQSKALVAAKTASAFNPNVRITPIHGNIKEPQFDIAWFRSFDIVLNALDNLGMSGFTLHVNRMCMAANVPFVESGTAGYLGQVQPIVKDRSECFDCAPKPTPTSFPVCTIRSTPSQPIHCIVWAKSYLLPQLFGEEEDSGELDEAEKQGENGMTLNRHLMFLNVYSRPFSPHALITAQEIAALRKEAIAFKAVRTALRSPSDGDSAAKAAFDKVFRADILNLLSMADMWRSRAKPTPLDFEGIRAGTFKMEKKVNGNGLSNGNGIATPAALEAGPSGSAATESLLNGSGSTSSTSSGLKDQKSLSLQDNLELFVSSANRLASRLQSGEDIITFDKDDDDTLDFVTAAANLRSFAYGIATKSRWEVKEMAGNIIPAIATTNAIIAGLIVLQALHLLRKSYNALRNVHVQFRPSLPLSTINLSAPNPKCGVCRDTYVEVLCDPARVTLGDVVRGVLGDGEGSSGGTGPREVSTYEDKRILSDPDWEDNMDRTLESLNVTRGKFLSIADEDGEYATIQVGIGVLPPNHDHHEPALILPSPLPVPRRLAKAEPVSLKRSVPDDVEVLEPPTKRARTIGSDDVSGSPSKKDKLEEDGVIFVEDDDVIVIE